MQHKAEDRIRSAFLETAENFATLTLQADVIAAAAARMTAAIRSGGMVMFCGNGGSAADSQHLAAELLGRFMRDRAPLPALALTVDTSALTAIGNDFGFEDVFARQIGGLGRQGDVLVALSTSGNSANVLRAIAAARDKGMVVIGLTGEDGGAMAAQCDLCVKVPARQTARIQEMHIAVGHLLCELVEAAFC